MVDHSAWNKDTPLSSWQLWTEFHHSVAPYRGDVAASSVRGARPKKNDRDGTKKDRVDIHEGQELQPRQEVLRDHN